MSSAPEPLATHEAIPRQGPMINVKNSNLQLAKAVTHNVWVNVCRKHFLQPLKTFWSGAPLLNATENQQQSTVPARSQETGAAANSFWQLPRATARRGLSRNYTLSLWHFWILQHIVNTYVPAKYLTPLLQNFFRLNTGNDKHLFCTDTQLCKNQNFPFLLKC